MRTRPAIRSLLLLLSTAVVYPSVPHTGGAAGGEHTPLTSIPVTVSRGWNLLAVPLRTAQVCADSLFPAAVSGAYVFHETTGYILCDSLQAGIGFWLKFDSAETVLLHGEVISSDTLEVARGWNIIGGLSLSLPVSMLRTEPPGLLAGQIFGFAPGAGYAPADTLRPGCGYWAKADAPGRLILPAPPGLPCPGLPSVEYGGKTYHTVQIGNQCWLRENLDAGVMVQSSQDQGDNATLEKYCFGNTQSGCDSLGAYYQWGEVMQYDSLNGARGICPPGWHVPTLAQLAILKNAAGGNGDLLKAAGQGTGTNASGFSALLAGNRSTDGQFHNVGQYAYFWASTAREEGLSYLLYLPASDTVVGLSWGVAADGFAARCLLDHEANAPPEAPCAPSPPDGSVHQLRNPVLRWSGDDPEGDPISFTVYFGAVSPPDTAVAVRQLDTFLVRSDLAPFATYFWRVVAFDSFGDSTRGPVWSFTTDSTGLPCAGIPTVVYGGKTYTTVKIGSQCWLRENLDIGVRITGMPGNNGIIEKYCYADDSVNCVTYGGLYRWREAMQWIETPGTRGVCPPGWHIPSWEDFLLLRDSVGGDGNALKAVGQGSGPGAGTNTSGFSALLAGWVEYGNYGELGEYGRFWLSYIEPVYEEAAEFFLWGGSSNIGSYVWNSDAGLSVRCMQDEKIGAAPNAPSGPIPPDGATGVSTQVLLQWSAVDPDGDPLNFDVYLGTTSPPESLIALALTAPSAQTGTLDPGTVYYWRVLAHDNHGHSTAGPVWSFTTQTGSGTPCPGIPTVTHGGKTYNTVVIGSRCWLKENLDIGVMINGSTNQTDNGTIEKYCYNNDPASCDTFGGLYQWAEAMQYTTTSGAQGLCPPGWHIPTEAQFNSLGFAVNWDANALKAIGQGAGAGAGSDTSGFSALLAGAGSGGVFSDRGIEAWHISSTQVNSTNARFMTLEHDDSYIRVRSSLKSIGFSVRCRMDQAE